MKKYILLLVFNFEFLFGAQLITNDTNKSMLCSITYNAQYAKEEIHGIMQRVQTQQQENIVKILAPQQSFERKHDGLIKCYNEEMKITTYNENSFEKTNERTLPSHIINHTMFDILSYVNEDRAFVDEAYGISHTCQKYKNGEYCKKANGLDIFFNAEGRVSKLFIYGNALKNGQLRFEKESFNKIITNGEPLGLWVSDKNKMIIKNKPDIQTSNVMIWNKPVPFIKRVVMTAKNGYLQIHPRGYQQKEEVQEPYDTLEAIEIEFELDDKAYKEHQKNRPPLAIVSPSYKSTPKVPREAKTTWGKQLNPKNEVPENVFKAFYINTKYPNKIVASEYADKVSINYSYDKFHGIRSQNFGAYWVGDFTYDKETKQEISVSQSWSKTRIIIDGTVIYEGGNNTKMPYTFSKGKHRIEIEYINNWHTTEFMVIIKPEEKIHTAKEVKQILADKSSKESKVLYAAVYESQNIVQSIELDLKKQDVPVVLLLNSHSTVEWVIENPWKVKIEAIIYSSHSPGVEIKGDVPKGIPIIASEKHIGTYKTKQNCVCDGVIFSCSGGNGLKMIEGIEALTDKKVLGFSSQYGAKSLRVPETLITKKWKAEQKEAAIEVESQRKACQKEINPSFEKLFEK